MAIEAGYQAELHGLSHGPDGKVRLPTQVLMQLLHVVLLFRFREPFVVQKMDY
jgi:hypothetical protein